MPKLTGALKELTTDFVRLASERQRPDDGCVVDAVVPTMLRPFDQCHASNGRKIIEPRQQLIDKRKTHNPPA